MIAKLDFPTDGEILLDGKPTPSRGSGILSYRNNVQMVFQDPFASLNPQHDYTKRLLAAAPNPDNQGKLREEVIAMLAEEARAQA